MTLLKLETPLTDEQRELLDKYYREGYRYAAQEEGSEYILLFNLKPKKYISLDCWGYHEKDLERKETLMAMPLELRIGCVKWSNRQPTLISELLNMEE